MLRAEQRSAGMDLEEAIRERAYFMWVDSGRLHGNADVHWLAAEAEAAAEAEVLAASMDTVGRLMTFSETVQDNEPVVAKPKSIRRAVNKRSSVGGGRIQASPASRKRRKRSSDVVVVSLN
jgi:hypothetical protein